MIFQLIYTGALTKSVACDELEKIAKSSRQRNMKHGITGILICKDGSVLQVLEGKKKDVTNLYGRISIDPRVVDPLVLIKRTSTHREFPNWSMGYRNADAAPASFELTANNLSKALPDDLSPEINTIGRTFARVNGLI